MAPELAFAGDARTALLFVSQPVFSGLIAIAMVALAVLVFRPRRPWLRAALWLLPVAKILIDVAVACPRERTDQLREKSFDYHDRIAYPGGASHAAGMDQSVDTQ